MQTTLKSFFTALVVAAATVAATTAAPSSALAHKTNNVVATAAKAGQFNTLIAAAKAAGLANVLATKRNITVFAPTDAAFARLGKRTLRDLLKPRNRAKLRKILLYHVVGTRVPSSAIPRGRTRVNTLAGQRVSVRRSGHRIRVNRARVIGADVRASNGVIHVINRVLLPR